MKTTLDKDELGNQPVQGDSHGWLPIDSAPKDGMEILGLFGTQVEITSFWPEQTVWCGNFAPRTPTHWMPLPPAPSLSADLQTEENKLGPWEFPKQEDI